MQEPDKDGGEGTDGASDAGRDCPATATATATASWLREDCLEFYRNELLLLGDGGRGEGSGGQRARKRTPATPVHERVGLLRLGIDRAMVLKKRFPNARFLEFGVHEGKDLVRMSTFLRSIEERDRGRKKTKTKTNNNNNNNNKDQSKPGANQNRDHPAYTTFHGFDSFEGLPEDWINGQIGEDDQPFHKKGAFCTGGKAPDVDHLRTDLDLGNHRPKTPIDSNNSDSDRSSHCPEPATRGIRFHKGWFHESLPRFLSEHEHAGEPVAFVHADADLYTSTKTVLDLLCEHKLLRKGSVLVFDEFWNYPNWQNGEYKAWKEATERFGLAYECFAYHAPHPAKKHKHYGYQSVGVVVTSNPGR